MGLTFAPVPRVDGVGQRVADGLDQIGESLPIDTPLRVIGPVPVYTPDVRSKIDRQTPHWVDTHVWRGLVVADGVPVSTIQFDSIAGDTAPIKEATISVRGRDSAQALYAAFLRAMRFAEKERHGFQVRFAVLPRLFITAVWLFGPRSIFIPTRTGRASRDEPKCYSNANFLKLVRRTRRRMRRPLSRATRKLASDRQGTNTISEF